VLLLPVTANVVPNPLIIFTLMMEAIGFFKTLALRRTIRRNIPEDDILE
jgi:hypothetical protein